VLVSLPNPRPVVNRRSRRSPIAGFSLTAHASGQWSKKINHRQFYLAVWTEPEAARARLNREYPYLKEGKAMPPIDVENGCTLKTLVNDFLRSKEE
jgi:hypothetical protein